MNDSIIEANLFELYNNVASAGRIPLSSYQGFECIHQPGLVWPDMIFYPVNQNVTVFDIEQLADHVSAQSWSKVLILNNSILSPEVQKGLRANGFAPVAQWMNMYFNLSQGWEEPAVDENNSTTTKVVQVSTDKELADWLAVVESELFNNQPLRQDVFKMLIEAGSSHLLLAYYNGKPAATAMLFKGTKAGLYMVATAKEYRRLGIGRNIMTQVYALASKGHYEDIVLHSTKEGIPFYSSLGFKSCGAMILFIRKIDTI